MTPPLDFEAAKQKVAERKSQVIAEKWALFPGTALMVSNLGNFKTLDRYIVSKNGIRRFLKGMIITPCLDKIHGYLKLGVTINGVRKACYPAHRIVAMCFIDNPENKPHVNHIDSTRTNNKISNLEWVTPKENVRHALEYGNMNMSGESHPMSKLSQDQVDEIRSSYRFRKNTQIMLAEKYGVCESTIHKILNKETWN